MKNVCALYLVVFHAFFGVLVPHCFRNLESACSDYTVVSPESYTVAAAPESEHRRSARMIPILVVSLTNFTGLPCLLTGE